MKSLFLLPIFLLVLIGCSNEEITEDYTIFVNDLPSGGPTLKIENDNLGKSIEKIYGWLTKTEHEEKFRKSLSWLQMESETIMQQVEGLTAKELIELANRMKSKKTKT